VFVVKADAYLLWLDIEGAPYAFIKINQDTTKYQKKFFILDGDKVLK